MGGLAILFKLPIRNDGVYLSDEELALFALNNQVSFDTEGIDEQIGCIVDCYHIGVVRHGCLTKIICKAVTFSWDDSEYKK